MVKQCLVTVYVHPTARSALMHVVELPQYSDGSVKDRRSAASRAAETMAHQTLTNGLIPQEYERVPQLQNANLVFPSLVTPIVAYSTAIDGICNELRVVVVNLYGKAPEPIPTNDTTNILGKLKGRIAWSPAALTSTHVRGDIS